MAANASSANQPVVTSAEELVRLVAQRKLWPLNAEAAEEQLRALGYVSSGPQPDKETFTDDDTLYSGRDNRVRARRRAPVRGTRFECDIQRRTASGLAGQGSRSGQAKAQAIGARMSGGPN